MYFIDTANTWPYEERNRWSRSRSFCKRTSEKQSNFILTTLLTTLPFIHYISQTLTTLNLYDNQISDRGAEHLANALLENNVTSISSSRFLFCWSFIIFHRCWQHLILNWTKLVIKELNILRMHFNKTR